MAEKDIVPPTESEFHLGTRVQLARLGTELVNYKPVRTTDVKKRSVGVVLLAEMMDYQPATLAQIEAGTLQPSPQLLGDVETTLGIAQGTLLRDSTPLRREDLNTKRDTIETGRGAGYLGEAVFQRPERPIIPTMVQAGSPNFDTVSHNRALRAAEEQPTRQTQAQKRKATRTKLLQAAYETFSKGGFHGATVDDIVQAAGYSKGAFYFHFTSKEEIFHGVLEEKMEDEKRLLMEAIANKDRDPAGVLTGLTQYLTPKENDPYWPPLWQEYLAHAGRNPAIKAILVELVDNRRDALISALESSAAAGLIASRPDWGDTADMLISMGDRMFNQVNLGKPSLQGKQLVRLLSGVLRVQDK